MRFVDWSEASNYIRGKSVAVVGSAPSVLDNGPGFVDAHEVVVRCNNYVVGTRQGFRTDIHYSFFGTSVRKSAAELLRDGVKLAWNKCPNSKPIESKWHEDRNKPFGVDFRYIYRNRQNWWPCDVFVPDDARFLRGFNLLGKRIPTTGFAAILDVLDCEPKSVYLTGFDFFSSRISNVFEPWRPGDPSDPIGHSAEREAAALTELAKSKLIAMDARLSSIIQRNGEKAA